MVGYHTLNPPIIYWCRFGTATSPLIRERGGRSPMEGSLALDGIATSAPYMYSALDPKSMEERGVEQFRRKPKFQYVRFMIVPSTIM